MAVSITGSEIRLPEQAREALERREHVSVEVHRRPRWVVLPAEDYELVRPLFERRRRGKPIPVSQLLDDDDLAIIEYERERDAGVAWDVLESWKS